MATSVYDLTGIAPDPRRPFVFTMREGRMGGGGLSQSDLMEIVMPRVIGYQNRLVRVLGAVGIVVPLVARAYMLSRRATRWERRHDAIHRSSRKCAGYAATQQARALTLLRWGFRVVLWNGAEGEWIEAHDAGELRTAIARGAELCDPDREDDECLPSDNGNRDRTEWTTPKKAKR